MQMSAETTVGTHTYSRSFDEREFPNWKSGMIGQVSFRDDLASEITSGWQDGEPKFKSMWSEKKKADARSALIAWLSNDKLNWRKITKRNAWAAFLPKDEN